MKQVKAGEWVWPKMRGYKMECCDCGLIHEMDFLVAADDDGSILNDCHVLLRAYRKNKKKRTRKGK